MPNYIDFQRFFDQKTASEFALLLEQNNIKFEIDDKGNRFNLVYNSYDDYIIIRVAEEDFEKADLLTNKLNNSNIEVEAVEYLEALSDEEVLRYLVNPEDCTDNEIEIIKKIAEKRKLNKIENIEKIKGIVENEKINDDFKNETKIKLSTWIIFSIGLFTFLNTILISLGKNIFIKLGLGTTIFIDLIILNIFGKGLHFNIFISILFALLFFILCIFCLKRKNWAFLAATIYYSLDSMLFLIFESYKLFVYHFIFLVAIVGGFIALTDQNDKQKQNLKK